MSFIGMTFGVTVTRGYPFGLQYNDAARMSVTESLEPVTLSPYLAKETLPIRCATDLKMGKGTSCDPSGDRGRIIQCSLRLVLFAVLLSKASHSCLEQGSLTNTSSTWL